ncbi:c-type cytochrome [Caballeronia sp. INDeC2]|uniref:c-type cytochrome n=1 Tax=Caballeronia sp. INDeC2 TaxID=2921747 RepID=UPI0020286145|nr:c-type cytochrome [Caballeronia sp. INDeC2]
MNDMSEPRVREMTARATLAACVIVDIDERVERMALDDNVSWIAMGRIGAFVSDDAARALDAARCVAAVSNDSAVVPSQARMPHEARYTWPLFDDALHPCDVLARNDGASIEVWCAVRDEARLVAQLAEATGLPSSRFSVHATTHDDDSTIAALAALAAVMLLHRTGRAVRVHGLMNAHEKKDVALHLGASLDEDARLHEWRYDVDTGRREVTATQSPNPYMTHRESMHAGAGHDEIPNAAHAFARESFVDEIARERDIDPLDFRLSHLNSVDDEGARELIGTLADRAAWKANPTRTKNDRTLQGRGFAFDKQESTPPSVPAYSAWIVDLDVNRATGDVAIRRVVAGSAKGRRGIGAIAGVSSARIAAAASRLIGVPLGVRAAHDETPHVQPLAHRVETTALDEAHATNEEPLIDTSPAAAAIANALFDATGVRFRSPPFTPERVRQALIGTKPPGLRRSWRGALAATGFGGLVALACTAWPWRAPIAPVARPDASTWSQATLARGREVAAAGDCAVCHTAPGGAVNAGGLALETPFGTVYTTNITPDEKTGIGNWSFAAFDRAMRQGISRDGHHLYPAFPYTSFAKLSDADMTALYAYLMSQPAVESRPPQTRLPFPLNQRGLVAGWNALYLKQGEYAPDPARSALWNRGKYLVDGAGHCGACHSPRNAIGAEKGGRLYLTGGSAEGWIAPSLTANSKSPVRWTEAALFDYLRTGFSHEHGVAAGPMAPVVSHLATLPEADIRAMAHYVASLSHVSGDVRSPVRQDALRVHGFENGKRIFDAACAVCHAQTGGVGNFGVRPLLSLNTSVNDKSPDNLLHVILHGIDAPATGELGYMPGFKDSFDDKQVADLVAYIRAEFAPGEVAWDGVADASAKVRLSGH